MDYHILAAKILGAAIGSSIAIVFKRGGDHKLKLLQRFALGAIMGFVFAPFIVQFVGVAHTFDYWLASATLGGVVGYLFLQVVFSDWARDALRARISGRK